MKIDKKSKEKEGMSNYSEILERNFHEGDFVRKYNYMNGFISGVESTVLFIYPTLGTKMQRKLHRFYFKSLIELRKKFKI